MITCYRTAEFNKYCKEYPRGAEPSLADTIVSWEAVYGPLVAQLERRVYEQRTGDFSGRSHLKMKHVAERLVVPESAWNDGGNKWSSDEEELAFHITTTIRATSSQSLSSLFNDRTSTGDCWNKSIFVTLQPGGGQLLSVCPIIPVSKGDSLGIFAGTICFSEDVNLAYSIPGPTKNLFLNYSHVTETLNQMQVSEQDPHVNVRLEWQSVNEKDETGCSETWRILVLATRAIMPFEPLICVASSQEQFILHQSLHYAGRGFLE